MANNTSPHILGTSANLLGFCLFVITSLHINSQLETHLIDQLTSVVAIFLTASCIFSFVSIRTANKQRTSVFEWILRSLFRCRDES